MDLTTGNENLITSPEDWKVGDLISESYATIGKGGEKIVETTNGTIEGIIYYEEGESAGRVKRILFKPLNAKKAHEIQPVCLTLITRPEDITTITDEDLDARMERLRAFNYSPVDPHRKKKGKPSSTRKTRKKGSIVDKTREAVKTGKVTLDGIDKINAMLAELQKGGQTDA